MDILEEIGYRKFIESNPDWRIDSMVIRDKSAPKPKDSSGYEMNYPVKYSTYCMRDKATHRIAVYIDQDLNKAVISTKGNDFYRNFGRTNDNTYCMDMCMAKIKSITASVQLFGNANVKKKMLDSGSTFKLVQIVQDYECKDGTYKNVVKLSYGGRSYVFLVSDLEFTFPDIPSLTKGYNLPLNRNVSGGKTVKVTKKNHLNLEYGTRGTVISARSAGHKIYWDVRIGSKVVSIPQNKIRVVSK